MKAFLMMAAGFLAAALGVRMVFADPSIEEMVCMIAAVMFGYLLHELAHWEED